MLFFFALVSLGTLLHAAVFAALPEGPALREAMLLVGPGNLGLAVGAAALLVPLRGTRFGVGRSVALPLGLGLAIPCGPLIGNLLDQPRFGMLVVLALGGGGLLWVGCCPATGGRRRPLRGARLAAAVAPAALIAALWSAPSLRPKLPERQWQGAPAIGPDVLLVCIDTVRADSCGPGTSLTPALDSLAAVGLAADYALAPSNMTVPSHVTLLSGLPVLVHGVRSNLEVMDPATPLLSERLRERGWRTAAVVSNYVLRREAGFARGFEVYDESPVVRGGAIEGLQRRAGRHTWLGWLRLTRHLPAWWAKRLYGFPIAAAGGHRGNALHTTANAIGLLRQLRRQEAPLFLFVHYMDPHDPYAPPPETAGGRSAAHGLPPGAGAERDFVATWRFVKDTEQELREGDPDAVRNLALARARHEEEIQFADAQLAELLAEVRAGERPTLVLVTGDHGEHFGEHGLVLHGNSLYEPLLRVPLVLAGPGVPARQLRQPPQLEDVVPTLLSLTIGAAPADLAGRDLTSAEVEARTHVARQGERLCIRRHPWKLLLRVAGSETEPRLVPRELYHLDDDPEEQHNVLAERREVVSALRAEIEAQWRRAGPLSPTTDDSADHRAALRALGYIEDGKERRGRRP